MEAAAIKGMLVIAIVIVVGMLIRRALMRVTFIFRDQLVAEVGRLSKQPQLTAIDRQRLNFFVDNMLSFRAGWVSLRAMWRALRDDISRKPGSSSAKNRSVDMSRAGRLFIGASLGMNPIAAIIFAFGLAAMMLLERQRAKPAISHAAANLSSVTTATC